MRPVTTILRAMSLITMIMLCPPVKGEWRDMRVERYTTQDGLSHRIIFDIGQDDDGYLWLATWDGLCRYDAYRFDTFNRLDNGGLVGRLHSIRLTTDGRLASHDDNFNIYLFDRLTHRFERDTAGVDLRPRRPNPYRLHVEGSDLVIENDDWSSPRRLTVDENKSLERTLLASYTDHQGNLWVAFNDALYKMTFGADLFTYHNHVYSDPQAPFFGDEVRAICRMTDGSRWLATKNGNVFVYDRDDNFTGCLSRGGNIVPHITRFASTVYHIEAERDGRVWITTKGDGLFCCHPLASGNYRVEHYSVASGHLSSDKVYDVYRDMHGRLWVATFGGGVDVLTPTAGGAVLARNFLPGTNLRFITAYDDRIVVMGVPGIYIYNPDMQLVWHCDEHDFSYLLTTPQATYVASMAAGLFTLAPTRNGYSLTTALPRDVSCNVVLALGADAQNSLWLVSDNKLLRYDPDGDIQEFDQSYFHSNMTFSEAHPCLVDSTLRIGYAEGWIEVVRDVPDEYVPPLYWKNISVGDTTYTHNPGFLAVPYGTEVVVEPVAIDFRSPSNMQYSWRLDNGAWHPIGTDRVIRLDDLWPGSHILAVRYTDCYGVWVDGEQTLKLYVNAATGNLVSGTMLILLLLIWLAGFLVGLRRNHRVQEVVADVPAPAPATTQPTVPPTVVEAPSQPVVDDFDGDIEQFRTDVAACIDAHIADPDFTVDELADAMGIGRTIFYKRMKEKLNVTPLAFIKERRIEHAKYLLLQHRYTVAEVAYRAGFSDAKYFGKVFKREVGYSPLEFVEKQRHQDEK